MSRIGNRELTILDGVEVKEENGLVTVKGPKGELSMKLAKEIKMEVKDGKIQKFIENKDSILSELK